jgi:hypothetical protein
MSEQGSTELAVPSGAVGIRRYKPVNESLWADMLELVRQSPDTVWTNDDPDSEDGKVRLELMGFSPDVRVSDLANEIVGISFCYVSSRPRGGEDSGAPQGAPWAGFWLDNGLRLVTYSQLVVEAACQWLVQKPNGVWDPPLLVRCHKATSKSGRDYYRLYRVPGLRPAKCLPVAPAESKGEVVPF